MSDLQPPLKAAIIPVTPLQQNCTLLWCTKTMRGAFVDPGGDLDGVPYTAVGLESVAGYPLLFAELIRRGWSDANLAKLAGGNVLRALRRAEAEAVQMTYVPPALSVLPPTP